MCIRDRLSGGNVNVAACGFLQRPSAGGELSTEAPASATTHVSSSAAPRILATVPLAGEALAALATVGQVDTLPDFDEETLLGRIADYQALIVGPQQRVSGHVVKYGYNLKAIGTLDSHLNNIDVSAARALGIEVCYAPDSRAVTIAEHTVARLLALADNLALSLIHISEPPRPY